jgi:preprotein translocase subunit SecF
MTLDTTIARSGYGRLLRGQTAIDFYGHRRIGLYTAVIIALITIVSLFTQGLNYGLDFEGGNAWDVPASETFGVNEAADVLSANGISTTESKIQLRSSESSDVVTVQVEELDTDQARALTADFAEAAGVTTQDISFSFTSSTWGAEITEKAIRALLVFFVVVSIFIAIRFEWRMAVSALVAMVNDVIAAVGVYSVFQFTVTPATVIAFLTILGYSLYDTIVVFDRVQENEAKYASVRMPYEDTVNISMNQVLMRSLLTSMSSIIPVISVLVLGQIFGSVAFQDFALALLVGMISGVYSSIFIATPLLAWLKRDTGRRTYRQRLVGEDLRRAVMGSGVTGRVRDDGAPIETTDGDAGSGDDGDKQLVGTAVAQPADRLLTHPPRPRKKKRR